MSKERPADDSRDRSEKGSSSQTKKPWKGVPEKDQRTDSSEIDLEEWNETKTH